MIFLAPWFLLGLTAAAIPLLLHLRRSRQTRPIPFSCTRFFDEQFLRAARRARIQDLLLMLLRVALLALLALALAQPLIRSGGLADWLGGGAANQVVFVLDDSASMQRLDPEGQPLLHRARIRANAILDQLQPSRGDRATVLLSSRANTADAALVPTLTDDLALLRRLLDQVEPTETSGGIVAAIEQAQRSLAATSGGGRIVVVSDLQASTLSKLPAADPRVTTLFVACDAAQAGPANVSVDAVQTGAARPMVGVPMTVRALLTNHGPLIQSRRVELIVDDEVVATRAVELPPGRGQVVRFVHRFAEPGWHAGRVAIAVDANAGRDPLSADDQRHFAVRVEQALSVLAINGAPSSVKHLDELFFLDAALRVGRYDESGIALTATTPEQVTPQRLAQHPVVVLANVAALPEPALQAIEQYVQNGGGLLITAGDRVDPDAYAAWTSSARPAGGLLPATFGAVAEHDQATPQAIDETHPAMATTDAVGRAGLLQTPIRRSLRAHPREGASVLLQLNPDAPLLIERPYGAGRVMLWLSTIDRDWTEMPVQPAYLPFVYRLLTYLAQPRLDRGAFSITGDAIEIPASLWNSGPLSVRGPGNTSLMPVVSPEDRVLLRDAYHSGVYRITDPRRGADDAVVIAWAANIDPQESILKALDRDSLSARMPTSASWGLVADGDDPAGGVASRNSAAMWDALLVLALIVAATEPWLANRLSRRRYGNGAAALVPANRTTATASAIASRNAA